MSKHYIDNEEFERIILSYKEDPETYEEEFVNLFDLLITNVVESFRFNVPSEDAKQDCFALILKTVRNFRPKKGTAFNFFTTVILNNIRLMYSKEKRQKEKVQAYLLKILEQTSDLDLKPGPSPSDP